jgi:hypothetical protein
MSPIRNPHPAIRDRLSRRDWFRLAAAGVCTASASGWLPVLAGHAAQAAAEGVRHKSCILLWMNGGPSHKDTFDLKPGTADGGEFKPIKTSVPGIEISEHFPKLARLMEHGAIIRGMSTAESDHDRGRVLMHTGYRQSNGGVKYPCLGALVSKELGQPGFLLPNFVVCGLGNERLDPSSAGYLGAEHRGLIVPDVEKGLDDLRQTVPAEELKDRVNLLAQLEDAFRGKYRTSSAVAHQSNYQRSLDLMRSDKVTAFDVSLEPASSRSKYGTTEFARGCLLARRLVEVGVPFVEVVLGGWDTHVNNFPQVKKLCAEVVDPAMNALIGDLKDRGLLDSTLVIWMGEFGRTPRINPRAGRDHYGRAWSTVLMGGGIKAGQVIGRTDKEGAQVDDRPVSAADFMATICQILGINWKKSYEGPGGRTVRLVDKGAEPIKELLNS